MTAHIAVESANLYQGNIISKKFIQCRINLSSPHLHFTLTIAQIHFLRMRNNFTVQIYKITLSHTHTREIQCSTKPLKNVLCYE